MRSLLTLAIVAGFAAAGDLPPASRLRLRPTTPLATARAAHTATTLPDGTVLVLGGFTGEERRLAPAERYDPRTERVAPSAQPAIARQSHQATPLADGRVLVTGGWTAGGEPTAAAELYDPATDRFTTLSPMGSARAGHEAVRLPDGRVLIVGGVSRGWVFLASAELFDPATGRFAAARPMRDAREGHAAVPLSDGTVLVVGGHRGRGAAVELLGSAERFDPACGCFTPAGRLATPRHKHDAVRLPDGDVLILGGADARDDQGVLASVERYAVSTGRFVAAPPLAMGRYKHRATSVVQPEGRVLLLGGATVPELYDPARGGTPLPAAGGLAGQFPAVALLADGRALLSGGYGSGRGPRSAMWVAEPE